MKSAGEIAKYLEEGIGHIYERPLMYGRTADGVDMLLYYWHEIWAMVHSREEDYLKARREILEEEGCNGRNFACHYPAGKPTTSDQETVRYVVDQWKKISARLGLSFPFEQ